MSISQNIPTLAPKATAAAIRKLLKAHFPATTFSVVTERGSLVSSVRIAWTDGPTERRVEELVEGFEAGHFDGMTDSYTYDRDAVLTIDGAVYRPGCRYVSTARTVSPALANRCIAQLVRYWGGISNPPVAVPSRFGTGYEIADHRGHERLRDDLRHLDDWYANIYQAACDRTRFARCERSAA